MKDRKPLPKKDQSSSNLQRKITNSRRSNTAVVKKKSEDGDNSEDDDDSDSDRENDVSRALFYYADELIINGLTTRGMETELIKAKKALEKCKFLLLHENAALQNMLKKASTRDMSDNKVPPGSAFVQRLVQDDRYLLCLVCINCSILEGVIDGDVPRAIRSLKEALVFFPRSAEANENLSQYLRVEADSQSKLGVVESLLRKAASCKETIKDSIIALEIQIKVATETHTSIFTNASSGLNARPGSLGAKEEIKYDDEEGVEDDSGDDNDDLMEQQMHLKLLKRELVAAERARESLALYLCQEDRSSEAALLLQDGPYHVRLSKEVLCYSDLTQNTALDASKKSCHESRAAESMDYLQVTDNTLSASMLQHMQYVFRASSPFWSEHHYDAIANSSRTAGYFSYLYPFKKRAPGCSIEQVIDILLRNVQRMFPDAAKDCNFAEWWVHTRPHSSGHQLHFDSDDEGLKRGAGGKPVHPMCSTVLYLEEGVGGPTLVTDQLLGGDLARNGWACFPKTNRLVLFDARYLHGVVPGKGINPDSSRRRLTFMVGFWRDIKARVTETDTAGPSQPFPSSSSNYTWHREMMLQPMDGHSDGAYLFDKFETGGELIIPQSVSPIWEVISKNESSSSISSSPSLSAAAYSQCFQGF